MYARTTTVQADPSKIDAGIASVRDDVTPVITGMDGCVGMSLLADRGSSRCIATSSWESEASMRDSADKVRPLRDAAEQAFGASRSTVETWEVAVVHRDHAMPDGACARVTWLSGMADHADRAADVFRMAVLPKAQELEGFCSGSLLISRETGRAVGTITFERREHLDASREAAARIREAASRDLGATVDDVMEMEVVLAHLHLPEMA
ncbi:antibiotic biosynthesis monooxygenase [Pedococcus sp. P5_B7]